MPGTRMVRDCGSRARNGASGMLSCFQRASSRSRPRFHDVISAVSAMPAPTAPSRPPAPSACWRRRTRRSIRKNRPNTDNRSEPRPVELPAEHHHRQHARAEERAGHRNAIGRRQVVRGPERQHQDQHADRQHHVDLRHVDLAFLAWSRCGAPSCAAGSRAACTAARWSRRRRSSPGWRSPSPSSPAAPSAAAPSRGPAGRTGSGSPPGRRSSARPGRNSSAPGWAARRTARRAGSACAPKCPMSAYSASAPVTHSTTAPSTKNAMPLYSTQRSSA